MWARSLNESCSYLMSQIFQIGNLNSGMIRPITFKSPAATQSPAIIQRPDNFTRLHFSGSTAKNETPPAATPSMHEFIGQGYHDHETEHAGFMLSNAIQQCLLSMIDMDQNYNPCLSKSVLEIGCSSGTSTKPMVTALAQREMDEEDESGRPSMPWLVRYDAIDIDQGAIKRLNEEMARLKREKPDAKAYTNCLSKVNGMVADAMRYIPEGTAYTHAVMQFALSHFDAAGKSYLLDHLMKIVDIGGMDVYPDHTGSPVKHHDMARGAIIITDEFLPHYNNDKNEQEALWKHHGAVIYDALVKGNDVLAELELEALYSGLHKTGDFKVPCKEFEDTLWRKGLTYEKYKTFPLVGDLTPHPVETPPPGTTQHELQANEIWQKSSRALFEATRDNKPSPGNLQLPQQPRELLHQLIQQFKQAGVNTLRPTPKPTDTLIQYRDYEKLNEYNVTHKPVPENEEWGVFTYKIIRDVNVVPTRKRHQEFSEIAAQADSPEQMAALILKKHRDKGFEYQSKIPLDNCMWRYVLTPENKREEFVLSCMDDLHRDASVWHQAKGADIPDFHSLQKPEVAEAWQAKVDFSKKALKIVVDTLLNDDAAIRENVERRDKAAERTHMLRAELARDEWVFHPW